MLTSIIVVSLWIILTVCYSHSQRGKALCHSNKYLEPLENNESILIKGVSDIKFNDSIVRNAFIKKMMIIQNEKKHHQMVFKDVFSYYYATISVLHLLTVIAGIFAFLIAATGWASTNHVVKLIFLLSVSSTTYFGLFPTIFNQKKIIEVNMRKYLDYSSKQQVLYDYCITAIQMNKDSTNDHMKFLSKTDTALLNIKDLYFVIDDLPIKRRDYLNELGSSTGR